MRKKQRICDRLIPAVLIAVFLISSGMFLRDYLSYRQADDEYAALDRYMTADGAGIGPNPEYGEAGGADQAADGNSQKRQENVPSWALPFDVFYEPLHVDLNALSEKNPDFVGVIDIPALEIRYPVVKSHDNEEYLHRTFDGTKNAAGCIFLDKDAPADLSAQNTFVYGHNMKNGSMFGKLKNFRENGTVDRFPYVLLYTLEGTFRYRIFACSEVEASHSIYHGFEDGDGYDAYIRMARNLSAYSMPENDEVDFAKRPKLLSLSTCTGSSHTMRYVVQCALVEKN
ncbi:class B sortase [[Clostridium] aminophilum]|uniref:Sortase B n=1 Tax=[Clostridium] aminophilum TaxID=1526 RepID=A0A1I6K0B2_9FIRM|nr:class B sortase [[Clostridium] aminophilum]SFR84663.1 sortase B [[Clostridium] aminophilum]